LKSRIKHLVMCIKVKKFYLFATIGGSFQAGIYRMFRLQMLKILAFHYFLTMAVMFFVYKSKTQDLVFLE